MSAAELGASLARLDGRAVHVDGLAPGAEALRGCCRRLQAGHGLYLHATCASFRASFETRARLPAGLTAGVVLEGALQARIGKRLVVVDARNEPRLVLWNLTGAEALRRQVVGGTTVRKVFVRVAPQRLRYWCGAAGTDAARTGLQDWPSVLLASHLQPRQWRAPPRALFAAERLLEQLDGGDPTTRLSIEQHCLALLHEALQAVRGGEPGGSPDRRSARRADAVRSYLVSHLDEPLDVARIARDCSLSASALQRLFQRVHGCPVMTYVRGLRLARARTAMETLGVSVEQAATLAGYTRASNFSTAFRRAFGTPPSACRRR